MTKRKIALCFMVMFLVGFYSECNRNDPFSSIPKVISYDTIVLRFGGMEEYGERLNAEKIIEDFISIKKPFYPNLSVIYEPIFGDMTKQMLLKSRSGTLPDIVWTADAMVPTLADAGVFEPLDAYMEKYKFDSADIYESLMQLGRYDNVQYMLPRDYSRVVTYYNKTIFDDMGVAYPTVDWTWQDFLDISRKLVKKEGNTIVQFGCMANIDWHGVNYSLIYGLGGSILSADGTRGQMNTPENIEVYQQLETCIKEGIFVNQVMPGASGFTSPNVAMAFHVRPSFKSIVNILGTEGFDVVPFPKLPHKAYQGCGTSGYAVSANSKQKDLAVQLLFHIDNKEGQEVIMETGNVVSVRKSLADSPILKQIAPKINHSVFTLHPERDFISYHNLTDMLLRPELESAVSISIQDLFKGQLSVKEILEKAQKSIDTIFEKANE